MWLHFSSLFEEFTRFQNLKQCVFLWVKLFKDVCHKIAADTSFSPHTWIYLGPLQTTCFLLGFSVFLVIFLLLTLIVNQFCNQNIVLYFIVYLLSSNGHMDRVKFYNNECIKLFHIMVHLLMQRGDWNVRLWKQINLSTFIVITRVLPR